MEKEKVLVAQDGNKYYPFDENHVWLWKKAENRSVQETDGEWIVISMPGFLIYTEPDECGRELIEIVLDECSCTSEDLFNYGCRC